MFICKMFWSILCHLLLQPFYSPFFGTTRVSRCQKRTSRYMVQGKINRGKQPTIRLDATPTALTSAHLHHPPFFTGRMPFLPPNQQHQSTEGNSLLLCTYKIIVLIVYKLVLLKLECRPVHNVMATRSNIGGALCSTPDFGGHPLLECHAVMLPKHEIRWNLLGCPKLANRFQALVGRSSPYCKDMWGRYCCITSFFPTEDIAWHSWDGAQMANFWQFFASCISSEPCAARFRPAS